MNQNQIVAAQGQYLGGACTDNASVKLSTPDRDMPEVMRALNRLRALVDVAGNAACSLNERLSPVLAADCSSVGNGASPTAPKYSAPLANSIDYLADQIEAYNLILQGMRDRAQV